jgi:peptidoglycan hydrolase-like protein with peptidoglycan-binding domain
MTSSISKPQFRELFKDGIANDAATQAGMTSQAKEVLNAADLDKNGVIKGTTELDALYTGASDATSQAVSRAVSSTKAPPIPGESKTDQLNGVKAKTAELTNLYNDVEKDNAALNKPAVENKMCDAKTGASVDAKPEAKAETVSTETAQATLDKAGLPGKEMVDLADLNGNQKIDIGEEQKVLGGLVQMEEQKKQIKTQIGDLKAATPQVAPDAKTAKTDASKTDAKTAGTDASKTDAKTAGTDASKTDAKTAGTDASKTGATAAKKDTYLPDSGLHKGESGPKVQAAQQQLLNAGFAVKGGADSMFGDNTEKALKEFQTKSKLPATGVLDDASAKALDKASAEGLKKAQERLLKDGGKLPSGADGKYGKETKAALEKFQTDNKLPKTGTLNEATISALNALHTGDSGIKVKDAQKALETAGYKLQGGADGKFGKQTEAAVLKFQKDSNLAAKGDTAKLPENGRIDEATLRALNLMSDSKKTTEAKTGVSTTKSAAASAEATSAKQ